jgi:hypothetical protein
MAVLAFVISAVFLAPAVDTRGRAAAMRDQRR